MEEMVTLMCEYIKKARQYAAELTAESFDLVEKFEKAKKIGDESAMFDIIKRQFEIRREIDHISDKAEEYYREIEKLDVMCLN